MRSPETAGRAGFTLLEVVVALAITGMVLLGARLVFGQLADGAERVAEEAAALDREANAMRYLRELVGSAEVQPAAEDGSGERAFVGEAGGVRFWTWCEVSAGWQERCQATLGLLADDSGGAGRAGDAAVLAVRVGGGDVLTLRRGLRRARLAYLSDAALGGRWMRNWESTVSLPLAIGVLSADDTVIVRIGERG